MAKPVSISVKQISAAAKGSVAKALERRSTVLPKPNYRIGFIPPYWWLGVIIDPQGPVELSLAKGEELAKEVHGGIADAVSAVRGGIPGVISSGGHIICGFLPPPEVELIEE
jgi:hypothetical protein